MTTPQLSHNRRVEEQEGSGIRRDTDPVHSSSRTATGNALGENTKTKLHVHAQNRFGEMFYFDGSLPRERVNQLLDFAKDCLSMFGTERPIVLYNAGFAAWQKGKL